MTSINTQTLRALGRIVEKPTATKRDELTVARHVLRKFCAVRDEIYSERRALSREAGKLRQFEPFTKKSADALEQQASIHRGAELEILRPVLLAYGQLLIHDRDGYMAALGFDAVCDLLNANRIEREQARADGVDTLRGLIFTRNLEDSASHRGEDSKRGPLFEACYAAFCHFIIHAPEGSLPDPFGPNGPLYGVPVRVLNPDGTETVKRPDLVVHDAAGSRVVKR